MSNFWLNKLVCVTGGTGFLGFHLVRALLERGARVRVLALPPPPEHPIDQLPIVSFYGDLLDPEVVRRAVADCEVVFHTAGTVAVWGPGLERMFDVHVTGTRHVLEHAEPFTRVVHTSSIVAVGGCRSGTVLTEDAPFNVQRLRVGYVHAKRAAEEVAFEGAAQGRHVTIVNPGYLLGPDDHEPSVMGRFCLRFWRGRMMIVPPGGFNLVDVRDVVTGHLLAAEHGQPGRRYILGGANHTHREFVALLAEAAGLHPRAIPKLPGWVFGLVAGVTEVRAMFTGREPYPARQHVRLNRFCWFCSSHRAERELGYRARPLPETLAETYQWHTDRGDLRLRGLNRWWMRPTRQAA
jgi:dihydroflavonol-4-reductase